MTKKEFLDNVNGMLPEKDRINVITDDEYSIVEKVYMFHPAISGSKGKEEIAKIYVTCGFVTIVDMYNRACSYDDIEKLERYLNSLLNQLKDIRAEGRILTSGMLETKINDVARKIEKGANILE